MCPKVSQAYKEATRNEILVAAEKVFARKGYHATSMDDIVKETRLSKGALYGYFDSKEDLFLALRERVGDFRIDQIIAAMPPDATALDKLIKAGELAVRAQAAMNRDTLHVSYEFWTSSSWNRDLHNFNRARYRENHEFLASLIREGIARGEFRKDLDPEALASILISTVDGLGLHWASIGLDVDWDAVERTFLTVAKYGIVPRKDKTERP